MMDEGMDNLFMPFSLFAYNFNPVLLLNLRNKM